MNLSSLERLLSPSCSIGTNLSQWVIGNTFPFVVFGSFGAFWLTFGLTLTPELNAQTAYTVAGGAPEDNVASFYATFGGFCHPARKPQNGMGLKLTNRSCRFRPPLDGIPLTHLFDLCPPHQRRFRHDLRHPRPSFQLASCRLLAPCFGQGGPCGDLPDRCWRLHFRHMRLWLVDLLRHLARLVGLPLPATRYALSPTLRICTSHDGILTPSLQLATCPPSSRAQVRRRRQRSLHRTSRSMASVSKNMDILPFHGAVVCVVSSLKAASFDGCPWMSKIPCEFGYLYSNLLCVQRVVHNINCFLIPSTITYFTSCCC